MLIAPAILEAQGYGMHYRLITAIAASIVLCGCSGAQKSSWDDIDYTRVARENRGLENDTNYTPPVTVLGCSDDDLYNCNN